MDDFSLSDKQWRLVAPLLPKHHTGPRRVDDRIVISGMVHVLLSGCPWRSCPAKYGPSMTVFNRFNRWKHSGLMQRILAVLCEEGGFGEDVIPVLRAAIDDRMRPTSKQIARKENRIPFALLDSEWKRMRGEIEKVLEQHRNRSASDMTDALADWALDARYCKSQDPKVGGNRTDELTSLAIELANLARRLLSGKTLQQDVAALTSRAA